MTGIAQLSFIASIYLTHFVNFYLHGQWYLFNGNYEIIHFTVLLLTTSLFYILAIFLYRSVYKINGIKVCASYIVSNYFVWTFIYFATIKHFTSYHY